MTKQLEVADFSLEMHAALALVEVRLEDHLERDLANRIAQATLADRTGGA